MGGGGMKGLHVVHGSPFIVLCLFSHGACAPIQSSALHSNYIPVKIVRDHRGGSYQLAGSPRRWPTSILKKRRQGLGALLRNTDRT